MSCVLGGGDYRELPGNVFLAPCACIQAQESKGIEKQWGLLACTGQAAAASK